MAIFVGLLIAVGVPFLAWCAYLGFCVWLVKYSKNPDALKHAATAARAFPFRPAAGLRDRLSRSTSQEVKRKPGSV